MGYYSDMPSEIREFQVFVKPAGARCNLSCAYCYYLDKGYLNAGYPAGCMNDKVLELYIGHHIEASTGSEIVFSWHGGEPTLAGLDFFRKAVTIQEAYLPEGSTVRNGIQTNATLITDEWGKFLSAENFYVGISLDGPEHFHNISRTHGSGNGTFSEVMRGLEILKRYNVPYEFLCVVSNSNVSAPLELYRFFKTLGSPYISFLPMVEEAGNDPGKSPGNGAVDDSDNGSGKDVEKGSGNSSGKGSGKATTLSVRPMDFGKFLVAIFDEWLEEDIGKVKVQIFEEALRTAFRQEHTLCIFRPVCGGVPVVEMNGDFYSCDHFVNAENRIGNIGDKSLAGMLDDPRQKSFGEDKWYTLPYYCLDCEVLDMCNGECPKNRFTTTPEGDPGLNYLCEGYRYFFNHCIPFVNEVARLWGDKR